MVSWLSEGGKGGGGIETFLSLSLSVSQLSPTNLKKNKVDLIRIYAPMNTRARTHARTHTHTHTHAHTHTHTHTY